ncbi:hypothetical protein [Pedobacter mucosus]|uniref:hypothetical protein n=1 Tax=Pedobacter mucosus TaxID=2895286 RepID=UPI001EE46DFF|nr:hypothetical protein [Pedobacter mucosus]UKT64775.1 hypothetical protein LOK61_03140 [Pedobacter mucosus]
MKNHIIIFLALITIGFASCSGNKADGTNNATYSTMDSGKSTLSGDTVTKDTTKILDDSTSNAPKMPGH